jgi:hypothetical protein
MSIADFISKQSPERKEILSAINKIIISSEKSIVAEVGKMMGIEMIIYKCSGFFKYGLSSVKSHMTLHLMPIYGSSKLHLKYEKLLDKAKFQKGCINFKHEDEMPLNIVQQLIVDCSAIDLIKIREEYLNSKKLKI